MSDTLTREAILGLKPVTETLTLPEGRVFVRGMTGAERDSFEASLAREEDGTRDLANLRARIVIRCLVDESGNRLFDDDEAELVGSIRAESLDAMAVVAKRLSALGGNVDSLEQTAKN